jgi:hypothetical protein
LTLCSCRIWVEDSNGNRIGGDKYYHDCSYSSYGPDDHETINIQDQSYTVYAKVAASFEKTKKRGPFNTNTCFKIHGSVDDWKFDQVPCS